jgi:hypothetical protein
MPENKMFAKILSDYLAQNKTNDKTAAQLKKFCDYASNWFVNTGLIGLGHTTNGMSLRFANGDEYILMASAPAVDVQAEMPAFAVTGNNAGGVRGVGPMQDSSIKITG